MDTASISVGQDDTGHKYQEAWLVGNTESEPTTAASTGLGGDL